MIQQRGKKVIAICLWIAALLWTLLCLVLSWQTGEETVEVSQGVAAWLLKILHVVGIRPDRVRFHEWLRKTAHFWMFFINGLLLTFAFWASLRGTKPRMRSGLLYGLVLGAAVAIAAEVGKLGIPGRHLTMSEMWLNVVGTLCGTAVQYGGVRLFRRFPRQQK